MPENIISPTIGRRLWYYPSIHEVRTGSSGDPDKMLQIREGDPFDAGVVFVWHDRMVNLAVTDHAGNQWVRTSVFLKQEGDEVPPGEAHAAWMPYQAAQAKKAEVAPGLSIGPIYSHRGNLELGMLTAASHQVTMQPSRAAEIAAGVRMFIDTLIDGPQTDSTPVGTVRPQDAMASGIVIPDAQSTATAGTTAAVLDDIQVPKRWAHGEAPRVLASHVEDAIKSETYTVLPSGRVTICEITLRNGFTVWGSSAVVFVENNVPETGRKIAREKAVDQVWQLLGYALREKHA